MYLNCTLSQNSALSQTDQLSHETSKRLSGTGSYITGWDWVKLLCLLVVMSPVNGRNRVDCHSGILHSLSTENIRCVCVFPCLSGYGFENPNHGKKKFPPPKMLMCEASANCSSEQNI